MQLINSAVFRFPAQIHDNMQENMHISCLYDVGVNVWQFPIRVQQYVYKIMMCICVLCQQAHMLVFVYVHMYLFICAPQHVVHKSVGG